MKIKLDISNQLNDIVNEIVEEEKKQIEEQVTEQLKEQYEKKLRDIQDKYYHRWLNSQLWYGKNMGK